MKITICIGSSCHVKGSRVVLEKLQKLIEENNLKAEIEVGGTFCIGKCAESGVSILVDDEFYSVTPDGTEEFFHNAVLPKLQA